MESNYTYNTQHECLQEVMLISSGNTVIQNKYKYNLDLVDSILGITNTANPQNIAEKNKVKFGGAYSHSYTYDGINRLVSANSKAKTASYWLDMTYGIMGEPLTKKQKVDSSKGVAVVCVCLSVRGRRPPDGSNADWSRPLHI